MSLAKIILVHLLVIISLSARGRQPAKTDFYAKIKDYNLSTLWRGDSIKALGGYEEEVYYISFPEPLGFIGDDYQRFYIHHTSVTKSKDNPYLYLVTGKTKVKNNICNFKGQILIQQAFTYNDRILTDKNSYRTGAVVCIVTLYEDSLQNGSGIIKAKMTSNFYFDRDKLRYNAMETYSDGYCNNMSQGTWASYKTGKTKTCNWGDFRIPRSDKLDIGAGEFSVSEEYIKNGWQTYTPAVWGDNESPEAIAGRKKEDKWWWE